MTSEVTFDCILACDVNYGIGFQNDLPWRTTCQGNADMNHFTKTTFGSVVIMGSTTFDSLPPQSKPLANRINVVLSKTKETIDKAHKVCHSLDEALSFSVEQHPGKPIFIIGGSQLYDEAFRHPRCKRIIMTLIKGFWHADRFINEFLLKDFVITSRSDISWGIYKYRKVVYILEKSNQGRKGPVFNSSYVISNESEKSYMNLMKTLLIKSDFVMNRTGIPTVESLVEVLRFPLYDQSKDRMLLPLLTSKYTAFKAIATELLWFLQKPTDTSFLLKHNVHIWDANSTKQELIKKGMGDHDEGYVGFIYGYQWRNFDGKGIDQLQQVVDAINRVKINPGDPAARRLIVVAWNPSQNDQMVLPPCHIMFQFRVGFEEGQAKYLDCMMLMRSADLPLGVPFNIASYALLAHIVSHLTKLKARELVVTMNICHIYQNQLEGVKKQLDQAIWKSPRLEFSKNITELQNPTLDDFAFKIEPNDFHVINYIHSKAIKYDMAV